MKGQRLAEDSAHSHVTGNGGVSGHRLGREVVVAVGAVQERLSPLAVDKISLQDEAWARAGHGVQGAATWRCAIVHIETAHGEEENREEHTLPMTVANSNNNRKKTQNTKTQSKSILLICLYND